MANKNVIIIGGGPGGYVCAVRLAQLGASVTLIEKRDAGGIVAGKLRPGETNPASEAPLFRPRADQEAKEPRRSDAPCQKCLPASGLPAARLDHPLHRAGEEVEYFRCGILRGQSAGGKKTLRLVFRTGNAAVTAADGDADAPLRRPPQGEPFHFRGKRLLRHNFGHVFRADPDMGMPFHRIKEAGGSKDCG